MDRNNKDIEVMDNPLIAAAIWIAIGLAILSCASLVGCSGRAYVGFERVDVVEYKSTMLDRPWYCTWIDCDRGALTK